MTTKGSPARWVLPDVVNPAETVCFEVAVPNEPHHIAAFRGAMLTLSSAYGWADDPAHTAVAVANVWRGVIENMGVCGGVQTKIRAGEGSCELQWSYDDWITYDSFDMSVCVQSWIDSLVPGMISDAIAADLANGTLGPGGQPGPTNPPAAGQCKTYHVELHANDKWLVPSVLNTGDTVHVIDAYGGATDGAFLWYCQNGKSYVLGTCGNNNPYQPTDPYQAGNHMQIIGAYNTTTPVYFDPLTSLYTIPSGVSNEQAWIQLNDGPLADNQGVITFDVEICSHVASDPLCHHIDFRLTDGGFLSYAGLSVPRTDGVGYVTSTTGVTIFLQKLFSSSTIQKIKLAGTSTDNTHEVVTDVDMFTPPPRQFWINEGRVFAANWTLELDGALTGTSLLVYFNPVAAYAGTFILTDAWVYTSNTSDFGDSNCTWE